MFMVSRIIRKPPSVLMVKTVRSSYSASYRRNISKTYRRKAKCIFSFQRTKMKNKRKMHCIMVVFVLLNLILIQICANAIILITAVSYFFVVVVVISR